MQLMGSTLNRVEMLTPDEKAQLQSAQLKVVEAEKELERVKSTVAGNHKMTQESYMEWSSWYEFNGDFILQHHRSMMQTFVGQMNVVK